MDNQDDNAPAPDLKLTMTMRPDEWAVILCSLSAMNDLMWAALNNRASGGDGILGFSPFAYPPIGKDASREELVKEAGTVVGIIEATVDAERAHTKIKEAFRLAGIATPGHRTMQDKVIHTNGPTGANYGADTTEAQTSSFPGKATDTWN